MRKILGGPSRSETGVLPKKNIVNRNASSVTIKGQSKSSSILNKACRERSPSRAASSNQVRPRTQSSNRNLPRQPSKSKEHVVSRTPSKTRDRSVSRPPPRGRESDRNLTRLPAKNGGSYLRFFRTPKSKESDRNSRLPQKGSESNRNLTPKAAKSKDGSRPPPKDSENDRNFPLKPTKSKECDRHLSQLLPKGSESDWNFFPKAAKSKESGRHVSRLPQKSSENFSRTLLKKESGLNVGRQPLKGRESDRNFSRLPFRSRDNLVRLPRTKESDTTVTKSVSKIRESDRNLPRLPIRNRDNDRNIARPVTRGKINDRNLNRPTVQCKEVSRPSTKCDQVRNGSQPPPKTKESEKATLAPASPSVGLAGAQPSGSRVIKQKSSLAQTFSGIPSLSPNKIFSRLSLKKLSSFSFKKKAAPKKTCPEPSSVVKDKPKPPSAVSEPSSTRLDEAIQSSGPPWTECVGTSTTPFRESFGAKQKSLSTQQSQTDQSPSPRPPALGKEILVSKLSSNQNTYRKYAGRRLEPAYQHDDIYSVESFVDCPEKSATRQEYECFCHPEESPETGRPKSESVCSGESSTKPREDYGSSPECFVEEPIEPKGDFACSPEMSVGGTKDDYICPPEDVLTPPTKSSVCSPEVSIGVVENGEADPCFPEISIDEPVCTSNPLDEVRYRSSQECDVAPEEEKTENKISQDVNFSQESKVEGIILKKSHSQLDTICQSAAPLKLPPKKASSTLKLTTSGCICVPISSQRAKLTTSGCICVPISSQQAIDGRSQQTSSKTLLESSKTVVTGTQPESVITSECLANKSSMDDFRPHKPASEPSIKPRHGKDIYHPKGVRSLSDLEAVRDALEKKSKGVNICPPKASVMCPPVQQTARSEDQRRRDEARENLVRSTQVPSSLRQETVRTSQSCTGAAQHQLHAAQEVTEPHRAAEVPVKSCGSEKSRDLLPVVSRGRVSKPPPADLTSYPEEPNPQSRTESMDDSGASCVAQLEKPSSALVKDAEPEEKSSLPKDDVCEKIKCKSVNESSDSTEPPPDASNLSSDDSHEKECSASSAALPAASTEKELSDAIISSNGSHKRECLSEAIHLNQLASENKSERPSFAKLKSLPRSSSLTISPKQSKGEEPKSKGEELLFRTPLPSSKSLHGAEGTSVKSEKAAENKLAAGADECKPPTQIPRSGEDPYKTGESSHPKESSSAPSKDEQKHKGSSGKSPLLSENIGTDRPLCLPHRRGTAESNDSVLRLADQAEALRAEEGTAARCQPITKLKLKKQYKEPMQSDLRDIQEDIRIWKDLYAGCLERLRSLQEMNQAPVRTNASDRTTDHPDKSLRRTSNNGQSNMNEIKGGMDEAVRVLESEYGQVESALRKHSAVLAELVSVLQSRMTAQPEAPSAGEVDQDAVRDVKDSIHYLKALITENETLTMQLAAERAKQQVLRQVQVTNDVVDESITATEDKLHRTNSLFKMQMKRLQYEISRLTEAHNIEIKAGTILAEQAEADVVNYLEALHTLQESNERLHELLSSKRFVSGQRVFKRASRGSFLSEEAITGTYCSIRREQLEYRVVISDRVQRNVELSNDEIQYLHAIGRRMCDQISETNEEIRKSEFAWIQLRKERDELTKGLYPDLERLQKIQDVAKEKLDLESKLRKENMLFRHQLEEFQKDLLEVETELMSGAITRRTEATKNKVVELETLFENAKLHNSKLREECDAKHLTISRHDSLASLSIDEEEFQRQISEKIQRMELRIQADMDRRLLRPKRYVLEAPGKAKVSFRGQRNVIRAPKNVAEWRRKREVPQGVTDPPKPQQPKDAQELRREILAKLAEEKEKAKEQLLRYEAHQARHAADSTTEPSAQELNELLGRLGRFLNQTRAQEPSPARPATTEAAPSLHGGEFGETLMHLIVQLHQLQSALTGEDSRRRRPPTLASERHRELLETLPDASKRGSKSSNPTRQSNGNNNS